MNGLDKSVIENNKLSLIEKTKNFSDLLNNLHKCGVFNSYMVEEIENNNGDKVEALYKNIITRGPAAFELLIGALFETDNSECAEDLLFGRYGSRDYLAINVKRSKDSYGGLRQEDLGKRNIYKMDSRPRGHVLIINIHDFHDDHNWNEVNEISDPTQTDSPTRRFGSYRDVAHLYNLFCQMDYIVTMRYDLTKAKILEELRRFRDDIDHSNVDSSVVIIMSHGAVADNQDVFLSYDKKFVSCQEIWRPFNNADCSSLRGKPKIFLFQMCRGEENDMGVEIVTQSDFNITRSNSVTNRTLSEQMSRTVTDSANLTKRGAALTDILIIHSTAPGMTSIRDVHTGSRMVQVFCKVFMNHACEMECIPLILQVNNECSKLFDEKCGMQVPWCNYSVTKEIYFNPGI